MTTVIQLTLSRTQNKKGISYFGGYPFMSIKEKIPRCPTCDLTMVHLCQIDHSTFPFVGLMKNTDVISRVFICTSDECPSFSTFKKIDTTIIQTKVNDFDSSYTRTHSDCGQNLTEKSITGMEITSLDDVKGSYVQQDKNTTKIVVDIKSNFDIHYTSSKGHDFLQFLYIFDDDPTCGMYCGCVYILSSSLFHL